MNASIFTVSAYFKTFIFSNVSKAPGLYTFLGLGYMNYSRSDLNVTNNTLSTLSGNIPFESESGFPVILGLGVNVPVGLLKIFFEGSLNLGFSKDNDEYYIPVKAGVRYSL